MSEKVYLRLKLVCNNSLVNDLLKVKGSMGILGKNWLELRNATLSYNS